MNKLDNNDIRVLRLFAKLGIIDDVKVISFIKIIYDFVMRWSCDHNIIFKTY